ncbi:MAG: hypothetical protein HQL68_11240 [Magnetococcales bacterium]|nr:hypothetical protein [Magnetococcales bacterium]
MSSSGGVLSHTVRWQEQIPQGVELTLRGGVEVYVDLLQQRVEVAEGAELKAKKQEWCLQIASYLARQALLEILEKAGKKKLKAGQKGVQFQARPDPDVVWWG